MKNLRTLVKGELLTISHGENADTIGIYEVLYEFSPFEFRKEYFDLNPDQDDSVYFGSDRFIEAMLAAGLIKKLKTAELYLGSYGTYRHAFNLWN